MDRTRYVLVRDDDVSFFTKPETLTKLYSKFFDEDKPVNFSVIPEIASNILISNASYNLKYDPCIPTEVRGDVELFPLTKNSEIVSFLLSKNCEVLQHGLTHKTFHGVPEFAIGSVKDLQFASDMGSKILLECFGVKPSFFIFPFNDWSWKAIQVLKPNYKGVIVGKINRSSTYSLKFNWSNILKDYFLRNYFFYDDFLMVEHSLSLNHFGSDTHLFFDKVQESIENNRITVLVNHYWQYFFDWQPIVNPTFFEIWQKIVDYLFQQENLRFITFSELYNLLRFKWSD